MNRTQPTHRRQATPDRTLVSLLRTTDVRIRTQAFAKRVKPNASTKGTSEFSTISVWALQRTFLRTPAGRNGSWQSCRGGFDSGFDRRQLNESMQPRARTKCLKPRRSASPRSLWLSKTTVRTDLSAYTLRRIGNGSFRKDTRCLTLEIADVARSSAGVSTSARRAGEIVRAGNLGRQTIVTSQTGNRVVRRIRISISFRPIGTSRLLRLPRCKS